MKNAVKIMIPSVALFLLNFEMIAVRKLHSDDGTDAVYNNLRMFFWGSEDVSSINIYRILISFFPIIIFPPIWGTYLYKDLNGEGLYKFIRYKSRGNWYIKKAFKLLLFSALSAVFLVVSINLLSGVKFFQNELLLMVEVVSVFGIMYFFSLIQNIISILLGTVLGFIYTYGLVIISVMLSLVSETAFLSPINIFWRLLSEHITFRFLFEVLLLQILIVTILAL
jgi:hypothetical protein